MDDREWLFTLGPCGTECSIRVAPLEGSNRFQVLVDVEGHDAYSSTLNSEQAVALWEKLRDEQVALGVVDADG